LPRAITFVIAFYAAKLAQIIRYHQAEIATSTIFLSLLGLVSQYQVIKSRLSNA